MTPLNSKLQLLQEEVIDIQLTMRDLEQQRAEIKKKLNAKLSLLLNYRKLLQKVKPISSFGNNATESGG